MTPSDPLTLARPARVVELAQSTHLSRQSPAVFSEMPDRGIVHLAGRVSIFDGLRLPEKPGTGAHRDGALAVWIGPSRWMLIGSPADAERWLTLQPAGVAVCDLSHGRRVIRITGPGWRGVVARGCPLDGAVAFQAGQWSCAQSLFSEVPVLICVPPDLTFAELHAPTSYGAYLRDMLEMAATG